MRFYADTSFLGNLFFDEERFTENARSIRNRFHLLLFISPLGRLEMRLATLWQRQESAWQMFLRDIAEQKIVMTSESQVETDIWQHAESLAEQKGRSVQPDALDSLHVVFALNSGCTHFLSYDRNTRQRAFAASCGLKVLPERLPV